MMGNVPIVLLFLKYGQPVAICVSPVRVIQLFLTQIGNIFWKEQIFIKSYSREVLRSCAHTANELSNYLASDWVIIPPVGYVNVGMATWK